MKEPLRKFIEKFDTFKQEEINAIVENTQVEFFKKGSILLREGEVCEKCYFVLSGCVRQYQLVDGVEKTTAFFTEEQAAVLYSSYMNRKPSEHYLACIEDCILTTGTREQEQQLHKQYPKLEYLVHTLMPHDYLKIQERLSSLINHTPEERYLILMEDQPELMNRVPLHQLASYIGVTPESFSRIRKRILIKQKA
ncbi:MAG: Crp/Fnr family transcriptional regulator [Chitinophagales bacterium]|nr:Crp/Fnr family transcriptional regulator [Chitinophagales bacterium]